MAVSGENHDRPNSADRALETEKDDSDTGSGTPRTTFASPTLIAIRVFIDVVLASIPAFGIYLYRKLGGSILTHNGFHCGDETLAYPYRGSTIPSWLNGVVGVAVPVCIIVSDKFVKESRKIKRERSAVSSAAWKTFPILISFLAGT